MFVVCLWFQVADEIISDFATIKQNSDKPLNDNEVYIKMENLISIMKSHT